MEIEILIGSTLSFLKLIFPIVLLVMVSYLVFNLWVIYARKKFQSEQEYVLLRIIPPKEVVRTPAAMELFINALHQTGGEATPLDVYWYGKSRPSFSLEIVSAGGDVGFYIRSHAALKNYIENQIYAQYPGIEVTEVPDYVDNVNYFSGDYKMFGIEYGLTQPDAVPITTYVDLGLDKHEEEEEKVDPITSVIEFLGSLQSGENAWIQMIIKAHKKEDRDRTKWFGKTDYWVDEAKKQIQAIRESSILKDPKNPDSVGMPVITKKQADKIDAIERNVSKISFDVGIRAIYIAEVDAFVGPNIPGLINCFKQYGSQHLNSFKPVAFTSFSYPWQDPFQTRANKLKRAIFTDYKNRIFFNTLFRLQYRQKIVLNSEELATIFHFPGGVASTPTLSRIQSRKGEPPSNLPIQ